MEKKNLIGQLLIARFGVSEWSIVFALDKQKKERLRLCSLLLKKGDAPEEVLARALSLQLGVNAVVLSKSTFLLSNLAMVPEDLALRESVLPVGTVGSILIVACTDPDKKEVFAEIEKKSGKTVAPHVCVEGVLKPAIDRAYHLRGLSAGGLFSGASLYTVPGADPHLEVIADEGGLSVGDSSDEGKGFGVVSTAEDIENIVAGKGIGGVAVAPTARAMPVETPPEERKTADPKPAVAGVVPHVAAAGPPSAAKPVPKPAPKAPAAARPVSRPADEDDEPAPRTGLPKRIGEDGVDHERPAGKPWSGEMPILPIIGILVLAGVIFAGYKFFFQKKEPAATETAPAVTVNTAEIVKKASVQKALKDADVSGGAGTITGKVLDANGDPMRGVTVRLMTVPKTPVFTVDDNGSFTIGNVPPGAHTVVVQLGEAQKKQREGMIIPVAKVSVERGKEAPVIIGGKDDKGSVEGTVTFNNTPVDDAEVTLFALSSGDSSEEMASLRSNAAGEFAVFSIPPGRYQLEIRKKNVGKTSREVTLTAGDKWSEEVFLSTGGIIGQVVDDEGGGVGDAKVLAYPGSRRPRDEESALSTMTDGDGSFSFDGIPAGVYTVEVKYSGKANPVFSRGVRVKDGKTPARVRVVIGTGTTLKLRLTDIKGRVMTGGTLVIRRGGSVEAVFDGAADLEGTTVVSGLQPGQYEVTFRGISTLDKWVTWMMTIGRGKVQNVDLSTNNARKE